MDPNQQDQPRPQKAVSAAQGSEDQPFDVPPQGQQLPFIDLSNYAQEEVMDTSCRDASTEKPEHDPATDQMIERMRKEVERMWPGGKPDRSISKEVFQGMTNDTNRAFNEEIKRSRNLRPFEAKFPGYTRVYIGKDPRWVMDQKKRDDLYKIANRGDLAKRGNLALMKKRAQESRQRSREVMRAMKREKDKGRARQLLMRSKAFLQQRSVTRPNPEVMEREQRKQTKKESWKGMAHRMVYQRSPYKVHSQNRAMVTRHMQKRRQMAERAIPRIKNPRSKLASRRDIKPIPVQTETGYDTSRVKSLPTKLDKHVETEKFQSVYQDTGPPYFPTTFRGFAPRPIPRPFLIPVSRLTTSPASSILSSASGSQISHNLSDTSSPGSALGSSSESSSDDEMQTEDTDADTEMED